ncbi:hypothetical protein HGB25_02825 [Candidatus Saccharibacteria bacterium]|nr:hypothetical protein [Candidatus Saccharibacteria bacterium]
MMPEYPNNPQPPVNSFDYLNQISQQPVKKSGLFTKKPVMIGGIMTLSILAMIILFAIISALFGGISQENRMAAKLVTTSSTVDSATPNIKSTQLRAINSNLKILLTNTIRDAKPILKNNNIDITKLDKTTLSKESNKKLLSTLEDARLNAVFDRTYAREMSYQLDTTLSLMNQIYNSTGDKKLKSFLLTSYDNLSPIQKQLEDYNAANG